MAAQINPQFILVSIPGHGPLKPSNTHFTDLDGHPVQPTYDEICVIHRQFFSLLPSRLQAQAACELLASIVEIPGITEVQESGSTSARTGNAAHAEENLVARIAPTMLANNNRATVAAMFVSLEPCHDNRYPGHGCMDFFKNGRTYAGVNNARFVPRPGVKWTPIFIFESQLPPREKSTWGAIKARGKDVRDAMLRESMFDVPVEAAKEHRVHGKDKQSSSQDGSNQAKTAAPVKTNAPAKTTSTSKASAPAKKVASKK